MSAPVIIPFAKNEKPTAERINTIHQALSGKFGNLDGTDILWPFVSQGDMDLNGQRLLRVREVLSILNMEEFGTDESAFDQAIGELTGGGIIFLPRNTTITLTRAIKIPSNRQKIYIIGSGHSSQIKMADSADDPAIVLDGCRRCRVSNLFINGNNDNNVTGSGIRASNASEFEISNVWIGSTAPSEGTAGPGIKAINCSDFAVKRCWIRNAKGPGVQVVDGCKGFDIEQVTVTDSLDSTDFDGDGIFVDRSSDGRIHGNQIERVASSGIKVTGCQNVRTYTNAVRVETSEKDGIFINGESELKVSRGIIVNANQVQGFAAGVRVGSFVEGQVLSNNVQLNDDPLLYDGKETSRVMFRNNLAFFAASHGIATIPSGQVSVDIDLGKSHLPIQAVHATWRFARSTTLIRNSVPAVAYGLNGPNIMTVSIAQTVSYSAELYYSIFV